MYSNPNDLLRAFERAEEEYQAAIEEIQSRSAELLKDIRHEKGWTQQQTADFLDCDTSYISKIENGHYVVGKPLLRKLCKYLGKNS